MEEENLTLAMILYGLKGDTPLCSQPRGQRQSRAHPSGCVILHVLWVDSWGYLVNSINPYPLGLILGTSIVATLIHEHLRSRN